jgi:hypothetical protein
VQRREHAHAFGTDPGMAYFRDEYDDPVAIQKMRLIPDCYR